MSGDTPAAPANTTSNSTSTPWGGAAQYLTNGNSTYNAGTKSYVNNGAGPTGAYEQAANYAQQYGQLSPEQTALISGQQANLGTHAAINQSVYNNNNNIGQAAVNGAYNTNFGAAPNASTAQAHGDLSAQLSGQPNMSVVGGMQQANIDRSLQGYNDAIQNLNQQTLPNINNDAFASGQYGGSRQGVAQGMALQGMERNARDLGTAAMDSGNTLYGNAYNTQQGIAAQAANNLAGMDTQNSQFNSTLANQNNAQQMAQQAQNFNNASLGAGMQTNAMGNLFSTQDQLYAQQQQLAQMPQNQAHDALNAYLGAISPGASLGGTTTQSTPYFTASPLQQAMGIGTAGAGLISQLGSKK